jgi:hypothetical protein
MPEAYKNIIKEQQILWQEMHSKVQRKASRPMYFPSFHRLRLVTSFVCFLLSTRVILFETFRLKSQTDGTRFIIKVRKSENS